jgi:polyhydroxyalkanoate synthesis regulator phasin
MTPEEQSEKFNALARELEAAGELNPTDAESAVDRLVRRASHKV